MGVCVLDDLSSTRNVEVERVVEMHPPIHLLWAHLAVHIHDELLLATQVHAPLVDNFNPLPILKQGNHVLDDIVNPMRHTPNAQHQKLGGLFDTSHDTMMASGHYVLTIDQHEHELGMLDRHRIVQHIEAGY